VTERYAEFDPQYLKDPAQAMPCLSVTMALACIEGARYMADIDVRAYISQLRQALPYVPPIPVQEIKTMHRKRDLGGIVKLIRKTMSVNVRLTLHWTDQVRGDALAWVLLPEKMPYYGTPEFAKVGIEMFIRKSFAEARPYNEFAMAVAHEFSQHCSRLDPSSPPVGRKSSRSHGNDPWV
jgi:hypothetical protein